VPLTAISARSSRTPHRSTINLVPLTAIAACFDLHPAQTTHLLGVAHRNGCLSHTDNPIFSLSFPPLPQANDEFGSQMRGRLMEINSAGILTVNYSERLVTLLREHRQLQELGYAVGYARHRVNRVLGIALGP
jgi:hypothetical protein